MVKSPTCTILTEPEICLLYETGVGLPTIGRMIGRSQCYLDAVLDRGGVIKRGPGRLPGRPRPDRRKYEHLREDALSLYRSGKYAKAIHRELGVPKMRVLAWVREAGLEVRTQRFDVPHVVSMHDGGLSIRDISRKTGLERTVIARKLHQAGRDCRKRAHAKWYWHYSPVAGRVRLHGTWELAYARTLDAWCASGAIKHWEYEPDRLTLGEGMVYIPDFKVTSLNGSWAYHEVKGALFNRALEKIAAARHLGHPVVLARRDYLRSVCICLGSSLTSS